MDMDDDEDLQRALALSVAPSDHSAASNFSDPNFVSQLLNGAEPEIQAALEQIAKQNEDENNNKDENSRKRKGDDL